MTLDEYEAIRLSDLEGLYHADAAGRMGISRQTFGRIIESARRKIAATLVERKSLRIEGGEVDVVEARLFTCFECRHVWELPFGTGRPQECPACSSPDIRRSDAGSGPFGAGCGRRRRGCRGGRGW